MKRKTEIDLCSRPFLKKIIVFTIPILLTGMLQLLYNAADLIVVGQFSGDLAMAAVSSTGALINLIINLFLGLSTGALAVMAKWVGAKNEERAEKVLHTSVLLGLFGGIIVGIVGFFISKYMLQWMDTPANVLPLSTLYLQIFFCGMPFNLLYNFGASILRACGDTKRPLLILFLAGIINILLNLLLVAVFKMSVAGVALATTVSQVISAALILFCLKRRQGFGRLCFKKLGINRRALKEILIIGVPAGVQSTIFSLSNTIIQSSINGFGADAMAGNGAAANIEGFVYVAMNAFSQACLTIVGQNYGAGKIENINRVLFQCVLLSAGFGLILGIGVYLGSYGLLYLYNTNPIVIAYGQERMKIIATTYFLCGIMEVLAGGLRGIGRSITPMITSIIGVCGVRILWIYTVFAMDKIPIKLYSSYIVSWAFTIVAHLLCYVLLKKKLNKKAKTMQNSAETI